MPESTSLQKPGNPNNYLKTLSVNGAGVTGFDGAKTEYKYTVSGAATEAYVDYTKVSSKSNVTGTGTITLTDDITNVEIVVTAQNGDVKKYKLTIEKSSTGDISVGEVLITAGVKHDEEYLFGFELNTEVGTLKSKLLKANDKAEIQIKNSKGEDKNSGILSTGDTVTITSNKETKTYTVIIYGDVNGDGKITAVDYMRIKNNILGVTSLAGAYRRAADANKDNKVAATDYMRIKNYILGISTIEQ